MKAHPALFEGGGRGEAKKMRNTFQSLRPEEFSSGDFGLRSFRPPEISACFCQLAISTWAEISDISGRKLHIFQMGGEGVRRGGAGLTGLSIV